MQKWEICITRTHFWSPKKLYKAHLRYKQRYSHTTRPNGYFLLRWDIAAISLRSLSFPLELDESISHHKLAYCWNVARASLQGTKYPWVCNPSSKTKWSHIWVQRAVVCKHGFFGDLWSHERALHIK